MKTIVKASQQWNLFLEFLVGQILIILTGILLDMVLILFVYQMSQSLFETSAILIVGSVANVLGSVLLSNVIDKIPAKWVMMRTLILKIFIICLLALFYKNIYIVFLIKFLLSFLDSVISPAQGVLLAEITDDRIRLNSIFYTVIQIFQTATWTLGIPIVLILKPFMTFCLILTMLFLSMIFTKNINIVDKIQSSSLSYIERLKQGWEDLFRIPELWNITIMDTCESIANVIWTQTFLLFFTTSFLGLTEKWWGFQGAAYFVGSIVGGIISIKFSSNIAQLGGKIIFFSSLLVAIFTGIYAINTVGILALMINFFIGIPYQIRDLVQQSLIQDNSPDYSIGRIYTLRQLILTITSSSSLLIFSYLSSRIGIQLIYLIAAVIYLSISIWIFFNKKIMKFTIRE